MKKCLLLTFIILGITLSTTFSAQISSDPENPSHNCVITGNTGITLTSNYACGGYFAKAGIYKKFYDKIELTGYSCPKDFTWKFTETAPTISVINALPQPVVWSEIIAKTTYLPECQDCRNYTLNSNECPDAINGTCDSCINGKLKWLGCKNGYKWNENKKKCIIPEPEILGCEKIIPSCTKAGEIGIAADRFTNKAGIAQNSGVQCDANDIIMCTGNGVGCQIAACNVGAKIAGTATDCNISSIRGLNSVNPSSGYGKDCSTDKMGLSFQWRSNKAYGLETPVSLELMDYTFDTTDEWVQGPCPTGRHIPTPDEWYAVVLAGNTGGHYTLGTPLEFSVGKSKQVRYEDPITHQRRTQFIHNYSNDNTYHTKNIHYFWEGLNKTSQQLNNFIKTFKLPPTANRIVSIGGPPIWYSVIDFSVRTSGCAFSSLSYNNTEFPENNDKGTSWALSWSDDNNVDANKIRISPSITMFAESLCSVRCFKN